MRLSDRSAVLRMAGNIAAGIAQSAGINSLLRPAGSPWVNEEVRAGIALASVDIAESILAEVDKRVIPMPIGKLEPTSIPGPGERR